MVSSPPFSYVRSFAKVYGRNQPTDARVNAAISALSIHHNPAEADTKTQELIAVQFSWRLCVFVVQGSWFTRK